MPVCSNCGGSDFVWAENVKTGGFGRTGLSLRSGGELALGTRVCRGCGHADLFVKDPTILRQPHTWRPGEFVAIPPRGGGPARPTTPGAGAPAPSPATPQTPAAPAPAPATPLAPAPSAPPPSAGPSVAPETSDAESPARSDGAPAATAIEESPPPESGAKRPSRRRSPKAKAGSPPATHE